MTTIRIAFGRVLRGLLDDRADDPGVLGQQVVAAHPRLAREAGGDDDDVGAGRVGVVVRAGDPGVVPDDRRRLGEVEALALRQALDDVDEDDVGEARLGDPLGGRGADVAGADDGDLVAGHADWVSFRVGRDAGHCRLGTSRRGCVGVRRWSGMDADRMVRRVDLASRTTSSTARPTHPLPRSPRR